MLLTSVSVPSSGQFIISEFMAANSKGPGFELRDEDNAARDWIEFQNPGGEPVNLEGWYLTDQATFLPKWRFPSVVLPPSSNVGSNLLVFASGKNRLAGQYLHTNFELPDGDGYLALVAPDGTTIVQEFAGYPRQTRVSAFGLPLGAGVESNFNYLAQSPGTLNPARSGRLAVTEIHYHPAPPPAGSGYEADDFQFIELAVGEGSGELRIQLRGEVEFDGVVNAAPGIRLVLVANLDAFRTRYGGSVPVAGEFGGRLSGNAGLIVAREANSGAAVSAAYDDRWHPATDGHGFSLVNPDPSAPQAYTPRGWRPSAAIGGSPGSIDPVPTVTGGVVINEALANPAAPFEDAIELFNPTTNLVDVGGWYLTDRFDNPRKYRIPPGTLLAPGEFLALDEHSFNSVVNEEGGRFELRAVGEAIYLFSADAAGELTGYAHGFEFGAAGENVSFGRHITSTGAEVFVPMESMTLLATNGEPKAGPVVISEVMFDPPSAYRRLNVENVDDEFIELHNRSDQTIALGGGPGESGARWHLRNGVEFSFPAGTSLPPGGYLVVVGFDPAEAPVLAGFRARYDIPADVPVLGPWIGKLSNNGDDVRLVRVDPSAGDLWRNTDIVIDRVEYAVDRHWPRLASGCGASLHRTDLFGLGIDPAHWRALKPTPGRAAPAGPPMILGSSPTERWATSGTTVTLSVDAEPQNAVGYQWYYEGAPLYQATRASLTFPSVRAGHGGKYTCFVFGPDRAVAVPMTLTVTNGPVPGEFGPAPVATVVTPSLTSFQTAAGRLIFEGTASGPDIAGVVVISRSRNGRLDRLAWGTTNWAAAIPLVAGTNRIEVWVFDSALMSVQARSLVVEYVVAQPLRLTVAGAGTVRGLTNGQPLIIGRNYRLSGTPGSGHVLRDWLASPLDELLGTGRELYFVMSSNLHLKATFIPTPFPALAGSFHGLCSTASQSPAAFDDSGAMALHVGRQGIYTGTITTRMGRSPFKGTLNGRLQGKTKVPVPGWAPDRQFALEFELAPDGQSLVGSLDLILIPIPRTFPPGEIPEDDRREIHAGVLAFRKPAARDRLAPGRYDLTFDDPARPSGMGSLEVLNSGYARFTGRLVDGERLSQRLVVLSGGWASGVWRLPYFASRSSPLRTTTGWLTVSPTNNPAVSGSLEMGSVSAGTRLLLLRGSAAAIGE